MRTIHEAWIELQNKLPKTATPEHKRYLRRIFYAGAKSVMVLHEINLSKELSPTVMDEIFLERLGQEIFMFESDMSDGRT